jgi:hypothetical protein
MDEGGDAVAASAESVVSTKLERMSDNPTAAHCVTLARKSEETNSYAFAFSLLNYMPL